MFLFLACTDTDPPKGKDDTAPPDESGDSSHTGETGADCVESAGGEEPALGEWQAWDNGEGAYSMYDFRGRTDGTTESFNLYSDPGWEAVRFELDDPGTVHAVQAWFAELPEEVTPITLGLYEDFGHNGFDFHPDRPLWTGTRCLSAEDAGGFVTFVLDPPLVFDRPTLLYGASYRDGRDGPLLAMDGDYASDGSCAAWDDCHSALNYPEVDDTVYYNGVSFVLQYDFLIQAKIETTATLDEHWFEADPALTVGSRASWGDYDDDGDDDVMASGTVLYRNDGGTFTDVSSESGVNASGISIGGGVWGDYDNDGCLDFFGFNEGRDSSAAELLLHSNCDGTFSDVTLLAGIDDSQSTADCLDEGLPQRSPTAGAAWVDFDNDGLLDLAQANFLCFDDYTNYADRFWHNEGDGVFAEWGSEHGFVADAYAGRGVAPVDADLDGDVDFSINNYVLQPNLYYENAGDGTYVESALDVGLSGAGTDYGAETYYGHTIGQVWGDVDGDGDWDAVHANLAHPRFYHFSDKTNLLIGDAGTWTDEAAARGIAYHETHSGPSLFDFENDGDLDLTITEVYDGRPVDVYENDGTGTFTSRAWEAGITTENGWGAAVSDYDGDGDQDYLAYSLFRNDVATGHWLELRLEGDVDSNRAAIGAIAWVTADGVTRMRQVSGGNNTGCQDSQTLHFGLGGSTTAETVEVWFPGGATVTFSDVAADAGYRVTESGSITAGLGR